MPDATADPAPASARPPSEGLAASLHAACWVCGADNPRGLHLAFVLLPDDSVEATFPCVEAFGSYAGMLHGGIISALLDGAMTNWLLAHRIQAVTAELIVRFPHPVTLNTPCTVRAWRTGVRRSVHAMRAELQQAGQLRAHGTARFAARG
jgi:uncharacterized protein (TIGR00369 family)